ncbi:MAG: redoxin domain-containing protein [Fimbriimonadaceae bacterium]
MPLNPGTPAPAFTLKTMTSDGLKDVSLSENLGRKNTVLLFFPAAFTSVCTKELCDVSAGLGAYAELDAEVYGISVDSPFAQDAWAKANNIGIPLLSDYDRKVSEAYDVLLPDLVGLGPASARAVVVIDKEGVVRYAEQTPTPTDLPNFEAVKQTLATLS